MLRTAIGRLRLISIVEGISFGLLVFVAMPLKYLADVPDPVFTLGALHGVFYALFTIALGQVVIDEQWSYGRIAEAVILSVIPLGALVFERRLARAAA